MSATAVANKLATGLGDMLIRITRIEQNIIDSRLFKRVLFITAKAQSVGRAKFQRFQKRRGAEA
ncbi:MAG: hypothetical protein NVS1B11_35790 [Terriglobales bacterium]